MSEYVEEDLVRESSLSAIEEKMSSYSYEEMSQCSEWQTFSICPSSRVTILSKIKARLDSTDLTAEGRAIANADGRMRLNSTSSVGTTISGGSPSTPRSRNHTSSIEKLSSNNSAKTVETSSLSSDSADDKLWDLSALGEIGNNEDEFEISEMDFNQFMDSKIKEILLEKTLRAADLRISCAHMKESMIDRQEIAIETAFGLVNFYLARSAYHFGNCKLAFALANRAKAMFREPLAIREYTRIVTEDAVKDANSDVNNAAYWCKAWQERLKSNEAVMYETKHRMNSVALSLAATSAEKVESKWKYHRAKAINAADESAFKTAYAHKSFVFSRCSDDC